MQAVEAAIFVAAPQAVKAVIRRGVTGRRGPFSRRWCIFFGAADTVPTGESCLFILRSVSKMYITKRERLHVMSF